MMAIESAVDVDGDAIGGVDGDYGGAAGEMKMKSLDSMGVESVMMVVLVQRWCGLGFGSGAVVRDDGCGGGHSDGRWCSDGVRERWRCWSTV
ncbi:hypothetical protein F0562_017968 [Nyssa sinensis]|uniref:Uncharacterized protein n=1 Tax=Nyssa sinensis TaxID=561372 RepID=A0A5J4ZA23_9ASTE|nr:hypothetical protein F0562_017968 [Nyssa sinensis]